MNFINLYLISRWIEGSIPILLFGLYYGFLSTLPIGPAQIYYIRSMLIDDKIIDHKKNQIIPVGKLVLSGSLLAQIVVFSSIYFDPIYAGIFKPHTMTFLLVPVLIFIIIRLTCLPWLLKNSGTEFFLGVALQLLNPALFGKSVYTRLMNMMLFRYSGNFVFLLSTAAGWLSGQILFVKMTKIFCSRVKTDVRLKVDKKFELLTFTFQIIFFGYFMIACYGRNPSIIMSKWNDSRTFIQGPLQEEEDVSLELSDRKSLFMEDSDVIKLKKRKRRQPPKAKAKAKAKAAMTKPNSSFSHFVRIISLEGVKKDTTETISNFTIKKWPFLFFETNRFNRPLRYVTIGDYIERGPVKSQVAEYFFDVCLSDGDQKISFTALPSMSFFSKMLNFSENPYFNQDHLDEWIVRKSERKTYLDNELHNRMIALSNGSPLLGVLEKRIRFSKTKEGKYLSEIHDPLLSGPFRGSMNQFKSPWMLHSPDFLKEKKNKSQLQSNNHDSTNRLFRISFIRPERIVQTERKPAAIKIISKWWLDKIRIFLLEEKKQKCLDESTLEDLLSRLDKIYPSYKNSLEYFYNTLSPAPLNTKIEEGIASCDKKLWINYLLHLFIETTGTRWELLLSVVPREQALLYERFFFMSSKTFENSPISMNIDISEKDFLKDFVENSEDFVENSEDFVENSEDFVENSEEDLPQQTDFDIFQDFFDLDLDFQYFFNLQELYQFYSKLKEKYPWLVYDEETRIRDFNRFIVPKPPSTLIGGIHDPLAVKDCLEIRPKKARQLIIVKPWEKIEKEKEKSKEGHKTKNLNVQSRREVKKVVKEEIEQQKEDETDDEEDQDIYVFSYPYEGDFRRELVKGAVRFQRRKVSAISHWIPRPESILFGRLKSMTKKQEETATLKVHPVKEKKKAKLSLRYYDKLMEHRKRKHEARRRITQQLFDGEATHYVRATVLFIHKYLRKRLYLPSLIIAKNVGRILLFQVPEWEQDWSNLEKESYLKCNYDGYELTEEDIPKKDYLKEGIQIRIISPFRLRPWYESDSKSTDTDKGKEATSYLTLWGTENDLPFGDPAELPPFWKPIRQCIWTYTSDRAKPIIDPIIEWSKSLQQRIKLLFSKNEDDDNIDTATENRMVRIWPTSNRKFSLKVEQDEPPIQMEKDFGLEYPDDWTTIMNDRINQMNEEYFFNLDIYEKLKADFKQKMDQPSPDIKSRLKKEWTRIKIWRSLFEKKSIRFIRKKLPYFRKVLHFRVQFILIDLKISILNLIESNFEFCIQLSQSIEAIQKKFYSNRNIDRFKKAESKTVAQTKGISQAYVFAKIWQQIRNMKGSYAKDLLESKASSPLIKKNVKEFLDSQGILDCKHPGELTVNHWKQWLKWCAGYKIQNKHRKNVIGNRFGWSEFASFLGPKNFRSLITRLKNRIKRHRYDLLAYSYLDHMKEDNHGPAIQYISQPDYQVIHNFQNPVSYQNWKKKRKKKSDSYKKKSKPDFYAATKEKYYKKKKDHFFQFLLFPDLKKRLKFANKFDDVFPPDIIRKQIEGMWNFQEIQVPEDFDMDTFVIETLRKREEEREKEFAALQEYKEAKKKVRQERRIIREERRKKLEAATSEEEIERLKTAFKQEDDRTRREKTRETREKLDKHRRILKANQLAKKAAKEAERKRREQERIRLYRTKKKNKKDDLLVRDFTKIYGTYQNMDKINREEDQVNIRIAIKESILKLDAQKAAEGDQKGWDFVKSKLDSKVEKVEVASKRKTQPEVSKEEIRDPEAEYIKAHTEYLKEKRRSQREAKRLAKQAEEKEKMKKMGQNVDEQLNEETEKLAYREMAKNVRMWRIKFELEKLPLTPWFSKFKNASRFLDQKKVGSEASVTGISSAYAEKGDLDLDLLETVLYLKSRFPKHKDLKRLFGEPSRRSMPLIPGYFNDRFLIYKIARLFLKLKKKKIGVKFFDRSQQRSRQRFFRSQRQRKMNIENVNEKISSSFIFEDVFLPRRRREFRILNLLNLENHLDESVKFNDKQIPNDPGFVEKNEHLVVDARQKIRRFLWPRYRFEDLICMNRFWWNTNNGSRSAMLRVRMYPPIDHYNWDHIQNSLYFIQKSFLSIREILQNFGNHTKSFLGTKHSPVSGRNEAINEVKYQKENSFCSSSMNSSDRVSFNEVITKFQAVKSSISDFLNSLRNWLSSLPYKGRDFIIKSMRELIYKVKDLIMKRISSISDFLNSLRNWLSSLPYKGRDFIIKSMRELKDFLIKSIRELKDFLIKSMKKLIYKVRYFIIKSMRELKDFIIKSMRELKDFLIKSMKKLIYKVRYFIIKSMRELRYFIIKSMRELRIFGDLLKKAINRCPLTFQIKLKLRKFLTLIRNKLDKLIVKLEVPKPPSLWQKVRNVMMTCVRSVFYGFIERMLSIKIPYGRGIRILIPVPEWLRSRIDCVFSPLIYGVRFVFSPLIYGVRFVFSPLIYGVQFLSRFFRGR
uniref:Protein TIC 214 n=1 Tax=Austrocedrus chilensis TaxID=103964 RepID=A0A6J4AEI7_AUSCH|nr:hypothetical protein RF1 [Austrocedrus chilensis]BBN66452.1 hypothetical protein [Austrocedrus chilensis]